MNILAMLIIYFYPEVAKRSLEEIDLLLTSNSLFISKNMIEYQRRIDEFSGNIAMAARHLLDEVDG